MSDDASFIHAIAAAPFDETLRLVYADWLEERGDPRAEYLRIEAAFRTLPNDSPEVRAGHKRWPELRKVLDPRWLILMDQRVATPPGIGPEGRQAAELIREAFIAEGQIETSDGQAFHSPREWEALGHDIPDELGDGSRPVLIVAFSGGFITDCFAGFDSDRLDEYLRLPEERRPRVYPPTLALRRRLADALHEVDLVARDWHPNCSLVCHRPKKKRKRIRN